MPHCNCVFCQSIPLRAPANKRRKEVCMIGHFVLFGACSETPRTDNYHALAPVEVAQRGRGARTEDDVDVRTQCVATVERGLRLESGQAGCRSMR